MTRRPPRPGALRRRDAFHALGFVSPALAGVLLFTAFPVLLSVAMSFYDWPAFGERTFVGLDNYRTLFTDSPDFLPAMRNTFVFTILYVPLNVVCSLWLATALHERIRGRGALRVLFFIPVVTPMVANVLVWKMLLQPDGLFNGASESWFGVTLPSFLADPVWAMVMIVLMSVWQGLGYNMLIFSAALEQLPEEVLDAARVDGATGIGLFWRVKLPMVSPAVFFAGVMTFIGALQVFAQPQLLTGGGPGHATEPLMQFVWKTGFQFHELGLAAAAGWVLFALIIFFTALQFGVQRKWVHYEH